MTRGLTLVSAGFLQHRNAERGEFYALMLFASAGMSLLAISAEFITIFVNLEVLSISTYALTAYLRGKFDNENIRVVMRPKKTDSVEAYIGDEFLGVLFAENEKGRRSYIFELPILDVDLEGGPVVVDD